MGSVNQLISSPPNESLKKSMRRDINTIKGGAYMAAQYVKIKCRSCHREVKFPVYFVVPGPVDTFIDKAPTVLMEMMTEELCYNCYCFYYYVIRANGAIPVEEANEYF